MGSSKTKALCAAQRPRFLTKGDVVVPESDGLELVHASAHYRFKGHLILMSAGFELYLKMAEKIANTHGLRVAAKLPKPFRQKQFAYLLMSLI